MGKVSVKVIDPTRSRRRRAQPVAVERILDAAIECFVRDGVRGTTMERIAKGAGMSRVWLYRFFENRSYVLEAVFEREVVRLMAELVRGLDLTVDPVESVADSYVRAVAHLRDHPLVVRMIAKPEADTLLPFISSESGSMMSMAVRHLSPLLELRVTGSRRAADALAECLVRLLPSAVVTPRIVADLGDGDSGRQFIAELVRPFVRSGAPARPVGELDESS